MTRFGFTTCQIVRLFAFVLMFLLVATISLKTHISAQIPCSEASFDTALNFMVGNTPRSVRAADFNGDGNRDLVVTNDGSNNVSILLGNGSGNFASATTLATGARPVSVAVADFNSDGNQDLAVANFGSETVSVFLGNGTGNFGPASLLAVGSFPVFVVADDLNGDANQDLAVANTDSDNVQVLLGDGVGGFASGAVFAVGRQPNSIAVGDFDCNGHKDLAVANVQSRDLSILMGDGTGTFGMPVNYAAGQEPRMVVMSDFNNDGKQDLAVSNYGFSPSTRIFLGNGAGGFIVSSNVITLGNSYHFLDAGDFNGDGYRDLVISSADSNDVSIHLGNGTGNFGPASPLSVGGSPIFIIADDLNRDNRTDLVTANITPAITDNIAVILNTSPCTSSVTAISTSCIVPDTSPPNISCGSPDGKWHPTNVSITCIASDNGSGLADPITAEFALSTNIPVGTETSTALTNSRIICDAAGNCATAGPVSGNMIDRKAPVISIVEPTNTNYSLNQNHTASYSCSDGGSGMATCTGPVPSGSQIDTASIGSKIFGVMAKDEVGNTLDLSVSYVIAYNACLLYDPRRSVESGAVYPIKIQLCDVNGANVSNPGNIVTAVSIELSSNNAPGEVQDSGNANPDYNFRYVGGEPGYYIFNLSTRGFSTGTYNLNVKAGGSIVQRTMQFQVK